jgi:threonine synthase
MSSYISTRGPGSPVSFTGALLSGLAPDGGLYMPGKWPAADPALFSGRHDYAETALKIVRPFVGAAIEPAALERIVRETYNSAVFDDSAIAPLRRIDTNAWMLELFHGPTLSFKDYALQLLGRLFDHVLEQRGERITIVGATSGDTGSAAIEACRACKNIDIFILHPRGRTSDVQRRQMTTVDAPNVHNIAIEGTFDDCQRIVKLLFADQTLRQELKLSAVNSINWARIMAQIVYYASASVALGEEEKPVSFTVPTGNFGNVFAAWSARRMGFPIGNLLIASNRNDILTRFFESGTMRAQEVMPSLSPSMDIQISSNFERYLFELLGQDCGAILNIMNEFATKGEFSLSPTLMKQARDDFHAYRCNDTQTVETMKQYYQSSGQMIDPHTAVGLHAAQKAMAQDPSAPMVIVSTAHPAKFPDAVKTATGQIPPVPLSIASALELPERFTVLSANVSVVREFVRGRAQNP